MPTQPVDVACNVNEMAFPFTVYVTLYTPFDEDLVPEHVSAAKCTYTCSREHVLSYIVSIHYVVCMYTKWLTSTHHSSIHVV